MLFSVGKVQIIILLSQAFQQRLFSYCGTLPWLHLNPNLSFLRMRNKLLTPSCNWSLCLIIKSIRRTKKVLFLSNLNWIILSLHLPWTNVPLSFLRAERCSLFLRAKNNIFSKSRSLRGHMGCIYVIIFVHVLHFVFGIYSIVNISPLFLLRTCSPRLSLCSHQNNRSDCCMVLHFLYDTHTYITSTEVPAAIKTRSGY